MEVDDFEDEPPRTVFPKEMGTIVHGMGDLSAAGNGELTELVLDCTRRWPCSRRVN
jgi:hypothetical protein